MHRRGIESEPELPSAGQLPLERGIRTTAPTPALLQPRDVRIVEDVWRYKFLNTDQLQRLHWPGRSDQVVRRRLCRLFEHEYLERLRVRSSTTVPRVGAYHLAVATVLPDSGVELHSFYTGHERLRETSVTHLLLAPGRRDLRTEACRQAEIPVMWARRRCLYDHVQWLADWLRSSATTTFGSSLTTTH